MNPQAKRPGRRLSSAGTCLRPQVTSAEDLTRSPRTLPAPCWTRPSRPRPSSWPRAGGEMPARFPNDSESVLVVCGVQGLRRPGLCFHNSLCGLGKVAQPLCHAASFSVKAGERNSSNLRVGVTIK